MSNAGQVVWARGPLLLGSYTTKLTDIEAEAEIISSSAMATVVSIYDLSSSMSASYAVKSVKPEGTEEFALQIQSDKGVLASIDMDGNLTVSDDLTAADVVRLLYYSIQHSTPSGHAAHMSKPMPALFKSS